MPKQILSLEDAGRPIADASLRNCDVDEASAAEIDDGTDPSEGAAKVADSLSSFTGLSATAATRRPIPGDEQEPRGGASSLMSLRRPLELGELRLRRSEEEPGAAGQVGSVLDGAMRVPVLSPQQKAAALKGEVEWVDEGVSPVHAQGVSLMPQKIADPRCPECGGLLVPVGQRAERRLDIIHYRFEELHLDRALLDCPGCCLARPVPSSLPVFAGAGLEAGDGLLARAVVARWRDQMSFEAQCLVWGQVGALFGYKRLGKAIQAHSERARALAPPVVPSTTRDGRWARLRQLFIEALPTFPDVAAAALGRLERLDSAVGSGDPAAELSSVHAWLAVERALFVEPRGAMQVAIRSFADLWPSLVEDLSGDGDGVDLPGRVPEDWEGGDDAAAIWSGLIQGCRVSGVDPWIYLRDLFGVFAQDQPGWSPSGWVEWRRAQGRPVI